jgi:general secretion pathway protein L
VTSLSASASFSRLSDGCLDFFVWWQNEMLQMRPHLPWRKTKQRDQRQVVIGKSGFSLDGGAFQPLSTMGETLLALKAAGDFQDDAIRLVLDDTRYLERTISHRRLPLSILKRAAELDILTETPFRVEDVKILLSEPHKRDATYFILRRDVIDELRTQFRHAGVEVSGIYLGSGQVEVLSGLRPVDFSERPHRDIRRTLNWLLALLMVLGCLFCAYQVQQKTSTAADVLDVEIGEASKQAHAARSRYDQYAKKSQQLQALKQSKKLEVVKAWEELSRILPDTAFLTDLTIKDERVEIAGFSEKPATLIGSIEASALFQRAQFTSPVVKVPGFTGDNFHISFEQEEQ